jgi:hypothetical protein
MNEKGLVVEVMGMDCTAGGVTSGKRHVVLVGPMFPEIFAPRPDMPALEVEVDEDPVGLRGGYLAVLGKYPGDDPRIVRVRAKPAGAKYSGAFGGHFVHCCDSRPIPVFDRYEDR